MSSWEIFVSFVGMIVGSLKISFVAYPTYWFSGFVFFAFVVIVFSALASSLIGERHRFDRSRLNQTALGKEPVLEDCRLEDRQGEVEEGDGENLFFETGDDLYDRIVTMTHFLDSQITIVSPEWRGSLVDQLNQNICAILRSAPVFYEIDEEVFKELEGLPLGEPLRQLYDEMRQTDHCRAGEESENAEALIKFAKRFSIDLSDLLQRDYPEE